MEWHHCPQWDRESIYKPPCTQQDLQLPGWGAHNGMTRVGGTSGGIWVMGTRAFTVPVVALTDGALAEAKQGFTQWLRHFCKLYIISRRSTLTLSVANMACCAWPEMQRLWLQSVTHMRIPTQWSPTQWHRVLLNWFVFSRWSNLVLLVSVNLYWIYWKSWKSNAKLTNELAKIMKRKPHMNLYLHILVFDDIPKYFRTNFMVSNRN